MKRTSMLIDLFGWLGVGWGWEGRDSNYLENNILSKSIINPKLGFLCHKTQ